MRARKDEEHEARGSRPPVAGRAAEPRFDTSKPSAEVARFLELQRLAGNSAVGAELAGSLQRRDDDGLTDEDDAEALQSASGPRTEPQARALVDAHVEPSAVFLQNKTEGDFYA